MKIENLEVEDVLNLVGVIGNYERNCKERIEACYRLDLDVDYWKDRLSMCKKLQKKFNLIHLKH